MGQPETATYRNGVTTTFSYSNSGNGTCSQDNYRLCTQRTAKGSTVYQLLRYSYYNVGNVHEIFDDLASNNTQTFTYDELNRLTSAQAAVYGTISYSYNEIGNMMSNSQIGSYNYPTTGIHRPHAVTTAGSNSYIYDDNGNMTSGGGRTIRYDYDNRPIAVTAGGSTTTFMYDANGSRVKKTANGVSTIYIGKLYENTQDGCVKYIFAGDQRIAMRDATGALFYYHTDHLGSSSVVTNAAGDVVENLAYFPYGQIRINTGTKDVHHKFTGQELDAETGLYFYGARYYDPQLGRFISADTIVPNPRNPQDMNRYSYVGNNPLNYIDPTGHSKLSNEWKRTKHNWNKLKDKINDGIWHLSNEIDKFFQRNNIDVDGGYGYEMSVDSGGNVVTVAYNPETGETFPYMPSSAAEVKTVSTQGNSGTAYTQDVSDIGGDGNCTRCMPADVVPLGDYSQLDYHSLLEGDEKINSEYGMRLRGGNMQFHGGTDYGPNPRTGEYGIPWFWPSNGQVTALFNGGINWKPEGFPRNSFLTFFHVTPATNLSVNSTIYKGTWGGNIMKIGDTSGPHIHIQFDVGGKLYNPRLIFP